MRSRSPARSTRSSVLVTRSSFTVSGEMVLRQRSTACPRPSDAIQAWRRETSRVGSSSTMSQSSARPMVAPAVLMAWRAEPPAAPSGR